MENNSILNLYTQNYVISISSIHFYECEYTDGIWIVFEWLQIAGEWQVSEVYCNRF